MPTTAAAAPPAGAQAKPVVWNLPHVAAPTYYHTINLNAFAAKVKELSKGRMEIRVHPAPSLYPGPELIPAVVEGRAEIAPVLSAYLTDILLELGVLELPFMTESLEEHRKAAEALRPFYSEAMAKKGLKLLTIHTWPSQQVFSAQPDRMAAQPNMKAPPPISPPVTPPRARWTVSATASCAMSASICLVLSEIVAPATNAGPMKFLEVAK